VVVAHEMIEAKALLKSFLEPYRTAGSAAEERLMTPIDEKRETTLLTTEEFQVMMPERVSINNTLRTLTAMLEDVR
jgi:hypothetical protein